MKPCCLLLLVALCVPLWASESYQPPEGGAWQKATVYLKPTRSFKQAAGTAVLACNLAETQHRAQVYAKRLKPRALYTIWLVGMNRKKVTRAYPLTSRWRPVRADHRGVLSFTGNLPRCPVSRDLLVIKYHRVDTRRGYKDGVTVLQARLADME